MDYLDCQRAREELSRQRGYLQNLRYDLVADDGHNPLLRTKTPSRQWKMPFGIWMTRSVPSMSWGEKVPKKNRGMEI